MTDYKVIKDIEYAKDLLQNRPEQDTVDYKVYEVLDDALDLIHDLRGQIAKLVAVQNAMSKMMSENQDRIDIEQTFDQTYGVTGGICPTCNNWIQSAHSFCGFCGQPIGWRKRLFDNGYQTTPGGDVGMKLYVQEMMDGLPKPDKQGYVSIAEMMRDAECPIDKKLKLIGQIRGFVTINGITKDDLFEMLGVVYDLLKTRLQMKY